MVRVSSDRNSHEYKNILANEFGALSESILRRKPPFNRITSYRGVGGHYFLNLLKYESNLDIEFRKKILEGCIASAKWKFQLSLFGKKTVGIPSSDEVMLKFKRWIQQNEQRVLTPISSKEEDLAVKEIIESKIKNKFPEFKAEIVKSEKYSFSYSLTRHKKIHIIVTDNGFLNFKIGLEFIDYQTDIAAFFDGTQSFYPYSTALELNRELNNALNIINILFNPIANIVKRIG